MSLTDELLQMLSAYHEGYRGIRAGLRGMSYKKRDGINALKSTSEGTVRVTLSRLKARGFVENTGGLWKLTIPGMEYLARKTQRPIRPKNRSRNLIIAFDIPEREKRKRTWLRTELIKMDFTMLQKSLWLGPMPLSQDFVDALRDMQILQYLKIFKVHEKNII